MSRKIIPDFYPQGLPLYWRDETSGEMAKIVEKYLFGLPLCDEEFFVLRGYLAHYINAPCWDFPGNAFAAELAEARAAVQELNTARDVDAWIVKLLEIGLDPL